MTNKHLSREEIDALLNSQVPELLRPDKAKEKTDEQAAQDSTEREFVDRQNARVAEANGSQVELWSLTDEERDALGRVGSICMGSASKTLSLLLKQQVDITNPRVEVTSTGEFLKCFTSPHISFRVNFTEGLTGCGYLIIKQEDTAVLADLMAGGEGAGISKEITETTISAVSEAMNQAIRVVSTAMTTIFRRMVCISPPEIKVHPGPEELPEQGHVVVIWFKMTVGSVLDTQIIQIMNITTAREQADLVLDQIETADDNHSKKTQPSITNQQHLDLIRDIPLKVTVLLGRTKWSIKDILELTPGSVVELQSLVDEPVEVLVNGTLVAMGEIVVVNENFGVQLTQIIKPEERMQNIRK